MEEVVPNTYKTTKKTYLGRAEGEGNLIYIVIFFFIFFFVLEGEERPRRGRGGRGGNFRGGARGRGGLIKLVLLRKIDLEEDNNKRKVNSLQPRKKINKLLRKTIDRKFKEKKFKINYHQ